MGADTRGISCCFDEESQRMLKSYRKKGLDGTSVAIAEELGRRGLAGSTVLELGCGFGALTVELVRRGAVSAVGVDLSPRMVQIAETLAVEAGLSGSISYRVGDAALTELKVSDVVVLDAVLCCYPDVNTLVDRSSSAASRYYAYSVPDDSRVATKLLKLFLPLQGVLMRGGFRFFVHPTLLVKQMLEAKGFRQVSRSPEGRIWSVFLFSAPGAH